MRPGKLLPGVAAGKKPIQDLPMLRTVACSHPESISGGANPSACAYTRVRLSASCAMCVFLACTSAAMASSTRAGVVPLY